MNRMLKEPLLHFLLLGAALFVLFHRYGGLEDGTNIIVVDDSDLRRMADTWQVQWQRPPTPEELNHLVAQHVRQEVFYREALRMQLDHNDEIVKRRLYQKMEFLMDDIAELGEPTETELKDYYESHRESYVVAPVLSLTSIYFNPDRRRDPKGDALRELRRLPESIDPDFKAGDYGDPSVAEGQFRDISKIELSRALGTAFADTVFASAVGFWQGPFRSGYGWHLVYIHDRTEEREADWEAIRGQVLTDFIYDRQQRYNESMYEEIRKHFKIVYDVSDDYLDALQLKDIN